MSKTKKKNRLTVWIILTVVFALVAVGCSAGINMVKNYRQQRLETLQQEAEDTNRAREEQYISDLAEFEQQSTGGANLAWPTQKSEGWDIIDLTNYPLEDPRTVSMTRSQLMATGMLLVNQWHSRPDDFVNVEGEIVSVGKYSEGTIPVRNYDVKLFPAAIDALHNAISAAETEGHKHYMVSEGYRTWEEQNTMFQKKVDALSGKYSGDELIEQAKRQVNYPGTSEFNSGLSFTLRLYSREDASVGKPAYSTTEAGQWMNENCWKYGLVFRFPLADFPSKGTADKSYKTGVGTQLNLYRYVGEGNAAVMHVKDFCLEEYVDYLAEHPHIAVFEDGRLRYEIIRQYVGDSDTVSVQYPGKARSFDSSLDNMGYVITVCKY
ncbi:MAG: D-alanyl-D-alanine carboxypeptidase family protein [Clostridia bacterium]|nr:D-alanyl-D-alanine carboxypeptidase family protein [Clostridia bacterium]